MCYRQKYTMKSVLHPGYKKDAGIPRKHINHHAAKGKC